MVLVSFKLDVDAEKVIQGQPWAFDRHLVASQRYDGSMPIQNLVFKTTIFWVQIHNLPFSLGGDVKYWRNHRESTSAKGY